MEGIRWVSQADGKELHSISILKENVTVNKAIHPAITTSNFDLFIKTLDKMNIACFVWPEISNKIKIRAHGIKQIFFQDPDGFWIEFDSVRQK